MNYKNDCSKITLQNLTSVQQIEKEKQELMQQALEEVQSFKYGAIFIVVNN